MLTWFFLDDKFALAYHGALESHIRKLNGLIFQCATAMKIS
jgi:hypothetical protein